MDKDKRFLSYSKRVEKWKIFLLKRFKFLATMGSRIFKNKAYTLADRIHHREPQEYVQAVLCAVKIVGIQDNYSLFYIIYEPIDEEFKRDF